MIDIRPIQSCPGYSADSEGHIWSVVYTGKLRALVSSPDKNGYRIIGLIIAGKRRWRKVHRLVAEAFIGPIADGLYVNHLDGDKANNNISNLETATPAENSQHAMRMGLWYPPCGKQNAAKTRCKRGHPFNEENTYNYIRKDNGHTQRMCRACAHARYFANEQPSK